MNKTFKKYMPFVLKWEGVWTNDPNDTGGKTMYGIIERELHKWFPDTRIEDLTLDQAEYIYWHKYFVDAGIEKLPDWLGLFMFDTGINMGRYAAATTLQTCITMQSNEKKFRPLVIDGKIGPATMSALDQCNSSLLFSELVAERMRRYRTFRTYRYHGTGWANRLSDLVTFYDKNNYLV